MANYQRLSVREVSDFAVVQFRDRRIADLLEVQELGQELYRLVEEDNRAKLVLDLAAVEFLSSAAFGKLISLNAKVKARHGAMTLCNIRPAVFEALRICHLDRIFDIKQDEGDALSSF
jgi:anti-sigma B factor antagonist